MLVEWGTSFGINFLDASQFPETHILQQVYCSNLFFTISGLPIWHQKSIHHMFYHPLLGPHLSICFRLFTNTVDLGTPFKIQWAPTWDSKSMIFVKLSKSCMKRCGPGGFVSRPAFPEHIMISCRLDLMVFKRSLVG